MGLSFLALKTVLIVFCSVGLSVSILRRFPADLDDFRMASEWPERGGILALWGLGIAAVAAAIPSLIWLAKTLFSAAQAF